MKQGITECGGQYPDRSSIVSIHPTDCCLAGVELLDQIRNVMAEYEKFQSIFSERCTYYCE
jgi:hypothetical protein